MLEVFFTLPMVEIIRTYSAAYLKLPLGNGGPRAQAIEIIKMNEKRILPSE